MFWYKLDAARQVSGSARVVLKNILPIHEKDT